MVLIEIWDITVLYTLQQTCILCMYFRNRPAWDIDLYHQDGLKSSAYASTLFEQQGFAMRGFDNNLVSIITASLAVQRTVTSFFQPEIDRKFIFNTFISTPRHVFLLSCGMSRIFHRIIRIIVLWTVSLVNLNWVYYWEDVLSNRRSRIFDLLGRMITKLMSH